VKVNSNGTLGWWKSLGVSGVLYAYRAQADGTGMAIWHYNLTQDVDRERLRYHLSKFDAKGAEIRRVTIGCEIMRAALFQSGAIMGCFNRPGEHWAVYDLAGKRLRTVPRSVYGEGGAVHELRADRDGVLSVLTNYVEAGGKSVPRHVLTGFDATAMPRWRSPALAVEDAVRTANGDIVVLSSDDGKRTWRVIRFAPP
jgi:hypothetical protein